MIRVMEWCGVKKSPQQPPGTVPVQYQRILQTLVVAGLTFMPGHQGAALSGP